MRPRKRRRLRRRIPFLSEDYHDVVALWLIRAGLYTREGEKWLKSLREVPDCLSWSDGLERFVENDLTITTAKKHLRDALAQAERKTRSPRGTLFRNVELLGGVLDLDHVAKDILTFAVCANSHEALEDLFNQVGGTPRSLIRILSKTLDRDREEVRRALNGTAPLISSGLIRLTAESHYSVPFELMNNLASVMLREHDDERELLANFFHTSPDSSLSIENFPHLADRISILIAYLKATLADKTTGVNVLLYGIPGTGKTELTRSIAFELNMPLYEVSTEDEEGDARSGDYRFSAYRLCQKLLGGKNPCLVLFDEAEDVFPDYGAFFFFGPRRSGPAKGWTNRILEENPVPSIWVTNKVSQIDPAFLRRFDMAFEVGRPPRSIRRKILDHHMSDLCENPTELDRLSEMEMFTPADAEKTARVLRHLKKTGPLLDTTTQILVEERLKLRGENRPVKRRARGIPFDLSLINADEDLHQLTTALQHNPKGTICLYGPPGTGKTEFGHFIAKECDLPILIKRASDLIDKYVGESEKNIAAMFEEARREKALLLLDEADSFLHDRRKAQRSWEITQVNELLVQMENFEGLFVCSTNLMDSLDQASIRRFAMKIKFDYMQCEQKRKMFSRALEFMDIPLPIGKEDEMIASRLTSLKFLTPGDFAVIVRKNAMIPVASSPFSFLSELDKEMSAKPGLETKSIGFM